MPSDWLYPISGSAGRVFVDGRRRVPVSFESFRDLVVPGTLGDDRWYLTGNYRVVEEGDRVRVYMGERNLGIVGVGTVDEVDRGTDPAIVWTIDRAVSARLCDHPFPAQRVRSAVRYPRQAVISLDGHPNLVAALDKWTGTAAATSDERLRDLGLSPRRSVQRRAAAAGTANLAHDSVVLGPLDTTFRAAGWDVGLLDVRPVRLDLAARHATKRRLVIVEAKVLPPRGPGRNEARTAVGQLLEYSWRLRQLQQSNAAVAHTLWAAFSRRPAADVVEFLLDLGMIVTWTVGKDRIEFARGAKHA